MMKHILYLLLVCNFSFSQNFNDKVLNELLNDSIFIHKLHYENCKEIEVKFKNNYFSVKEISNHKNQIFFISDKYSDDDFNQVKFNKNVLKENSQELKNKLRTCSFLFIDNIIKKGKYITVSYYCPQKDLMGKIKFKFKNKKFIIIERQMGYL